MIKDRRYGNVKNQILGKHVKTLEDIFINEVHKKSVVARDLKISLDRFDDKMADISKFRMAELIRLSDLLEVDILEVLVLVANQHRASLKKGTRK